MRFRPVRYPCHYPSRLCLPELEVPVRVVNISPQGAQLQGVGHLAEVLQPGMQVRILLAGTVQDAELRWLRGDSCGLRLAQVLSPRDMASVRQMTVARSGRAGAWNTHLRELGR
jgi:hypothetical protein